MPAKTTTIRKKAFREIEALAFAEDSNSSTKLSALKTLIELCDRSDTESETRKKLDKILSLLDMECKCDE